ncbi:MAG: type IV pilus biogenesis/stability protein PilW [Porticoccaceae bacterium]|nr:type IV pilus biogenesis/stability protein PilW [Porticoccaceae bacterium]
MIKLIAVSLIVILGAVSSACTTTTTRSGNSLSSSSNVSSSQRQQRKEDGLETSIKLGLGYLREGNRDGAKLHLRKALKANPRSAMAHNAMALLYQLEKDNDLVEEHFLKALKYDPELTAGRNNYAVFLMRSGRNEEAYTHLVRAAKDIEYSRRGRVYLSLGQVAKRLGKNEEALAAWGKSINIDPNMVPSYLALATAYFDNNDLPRAKRYLEKYDELAGPRASALWLGVRLEQAFGNRDAVASKALALEKMFPYSQQYLDYQEWQKNQ